MISFRFVVLALLISAAAVAQAPPPQPVANQAGANQAEMTTHDAPATFTSRVNLVMVPVVVRDNKGNAIGNPEPAGFPTLR